MWIASVGTTIVLARLVFFRLHITPTPSFAWIPSLLLVAGLLFAEVKTSHFDKAAVLTALGILLTGWGLHWIAFKRLMRVMLPDRWERFEDVVGLTCISLLAMMFLRMGL